MSSKVYVIINQNGGENGVQMNEGEMNNGQLNNNQSSGCQINQDQINGGQINQDQINGGQMNGDEMNGDEMNADQSSGGQMNGDQINNDQSSRGQMNGVRLNSHQSSGGQMNTGQNLVFQMLTTKDLQIKHVDGLNPGEKNKYWKCVSLRESRFLEALEALQVWVLRVEAKIKLDQLSLETNYAAYLIFKTKPNSKGLDAYQRALVYSDGYRWEKNVCISPGVVRPGNKCNVYPIKRSDGWMELELGQFYCDGDAGEVGLCLEETSKNEKTGLIISGIEVRPF